MRTLMAKVSTRLISSALTESNDTINTCVCVCVCVCVCMCVCVCVCE